MATQTVERIIESLGGIFAPNTAAYAAAISEVASCREHDAYLAGVVEEMHEPEELAVLHWAEIRGHLWD